MKCRYAKCLLWFMLGAVTSIVIYGDHSKPGAKNFSLFLS